MGTVYPGIHEKLALKARDYFGLKSLVETGTYKGDTTCWARDNFEMVVSVEISPTLFKLAEARINHAHNVLLILGDSRDWLAQICRGRQNSPTLFWLDSHWTGELEIETDACPIVDEIKIINMNFFGSHVIMVDDYSTINRLKWAQQSEIEAALVSDKWQNRQFRIVDDVYFAASRIPEDFENWNH